MIWAVGYFAIAFLAWIITTRVVGEYIKNDLGDDRLDAFGYVMSTLVGLVAAFLWPLVVVAAIVAHLAFGTNILKPKGQGK